MQYYIYANEESSNAISLKMVCTNATFHPRNPSGRSDQSHLQKALDLENKCIIKKSFMLRAAGTDLVICGEEREGKEDVEYSMF